MFDSGQKAPENRIHLFDPVGLINDKYAQYGVQPRRATSNAAGGGLRFTVEPKATDSDSDGSSPRLWNPSRNNSPPTSPRFTISPPHQLQNPNHHHHHHLHHQNAEPMSPNSRTQAIARGRKELMDMIKDMPETYYELSLRDIVEKKPPSPPPTSSATVVQPLQETKKVEVVEKKFPLEAPKEKKQSKKKKGGKKVGKSESKKKMVRSKSVDNGGFLLRTTVFPIPFRRRRKKKSLSAAPSFKVAQKPTTKGSVKGTGKRWWVRKSRVSNETESGGLTTDSASSSRSSSIVSRNNRFLPSCCAFFNDKKMKSKK